MLSEERHNAIVAEINQFGSVRVKELSRKFQVTDDCIRKDLTLLENQGLLKKTYGGAVRVRSMGHDFQVSDRIDKNIDAKRAIARKAVELIGDNSTVFLDISTSSIEIAKLLILSGKSVTLITNCIDVIQVLKDTPSNVRVIALGGVLSPHLRGGFVGAPTDDQLRRYHFDLSFIGTTGVDLQYNRVSTYLSEDGITKRLAAECSDKAYLLLENRKLHEDGTYWYAKLSNFTGAILDNLPDETTQKMMNKYDVEWL